MWLSVFAALVILLCGVIFTRYHIPALIFGAGIFVLYLVLLLWYIPSYVNRLNVEIAADKLVVRNGVIFHRVRVIPSVRAVYCEYRQGIVARIFGLCTLYIRLAHRSVAIIGLTIASAERIIELTEGRE